MMSAVCIPGSAAEVAANVFQEFQSEQDHFEYRRIDPHRALIQVRFARNRIQVKPLVFALPWDASLEWTLVGARATRSRETFRVDPGTVENLESWFEVSRKWLSDFPLCCIEFPLVRQIPLRAPGDDLAEPSQVAEATFEIRFSRLYEPSQGTSGSPDGDRDPFAKLAGLLVANPEEIEWARGVPESLGESISDGLSFPHFIRAVSGNSLLRIQVEGMGVTQFSGADLARTGFDWENHPASNLTLYHRGRPYALGRESGSDSAPLSASDTLWFPHFPVESPETNRNTFYLTWEDRPGPRILSTYQPAPFPQGRSWDYLPMDFERDEPGLKRVLNDRGEIELGWTAFDRPDRTFDLDFDLPGLLPQGESQEVTEALLEIFSWTDEASNPANGASFWVAVNGHLPLEAKPSSGSSRSTVQIPLDQLRSLGNRLEISLPSPPQVGRVVLDRFVLWAPRLPQPLRMVEVPRVDVPESFRTEGVGVERVVEGPPEGWRILHASGEGGWEYCPLDTAGGTVRLPPQSQAQRDWVVTLDQATPPASLTLVRPDLDEILDGQADLLVILDERFRPTLVPYLERRKQQGWTYRLATTQEIYDLFSDGIKDIGAIRAYCRHAFFHYQPPRPQALWLVGESKWDGKGVLPSGIEDLVPSPVFETEAGLSSNDQEYAQILGQDDLPDLLVSRVSVSSSRELQAYLDKALAKETVEPLGWWRATSLLLSDREFSKAHPDNLKAGLGTVRFPTEVDLLDYPLDTIRSFEAVGKVAHEARGARQEVVRRWSQGTSMVEYVGHGGVTVWSTRAMFKGLDRPDSDILRLRNAGEYPFVLIRSCLSSSVNWPIHPGAVSMAEALIKAPGAGAVAVLGSAGTEYQSDQESYASHIHGALWNHGIELLGLIRAYAHCQYKLKVSGGGEVADQFMLHGDPLLHLDYPRPIQLHPPVWTRNPGNPRLSASWSHPLQNVQGELRIYRRGEVLFESEEMDLRPGQGSGEWSIAPEVACLDGLSVGVYLWDEQAHRDVFGATGVPPLPSPDPFRLDLEKQNEGPIQGVSLVNPPESVQAGDPILLSFKAEVFPSSQDVVCDVHLVLEGTAGPGKHLRIISGQAGYVSVPFLPTGSGGKEVSLVFDSKDLMPERWSQEFRGRIEVQPRSRLRMGGHHLDPKDPVEGEEVFLALDFINDGTTEVEVVSLACELEPQSNPQREPLALLESDVEVFPMRLSPGEGRTKKWRTQTGLPIGEYCVHFEVLTQDGMQSQMTTFRVAEPPVLEVVSVEPGVKPEPGTDQTDVRVEARIRNTGESRSDPLRLQLRETDSGEEFEALVPSLAPSEEIAVVVDLPSGQSHFLWNTAFELLPEAITSRTRWHPHKLVTDLLPVVTLAWPESSPVWEQTIETEKDWAPFSGRFLDRTQLGFRISSSARERHYQPGALAIPDPHEVRGATQAELASLQDPTGWWITPTTLQAHPNWKGHPLRLLLPWSDQECLALVSPVYKKADRFLGAPMPAFHLQAGPIDFNVLPSNTHVEGTFEEKRVPIKSPGLELRVDKSHGFWPGFAGIHLRPLPEIRSPVYELPGPGPWELAFDPVCVGFEPGDPLKQVRVREGDSVWGPWTPILPGGRIEGSHIQFRFAFRPSQISNQMLIRSVRVQIRKAL